MTNSRFIQISFQRLNKYLTKVCYRGIQLAACEIKNEFDLARLDTCIPLVAVLKIGVCGYEEKCPQL